MMLRIGTVAVLSVLTLQFAIADPPGDQLVDQVEQAYDQTAQYQATLHFGVNQKQGRWTTSQQADFRVAYDRAGGRLMIDKPDLYLVVADGTLRLRSDQLPGRHLEMPAPSPLSYETLLDAVPFLGQPPLIDVMFLLAENPAEAIAQGQAAQVTTLAPAEGETAPRLRFETPQGRLTLTLDEQTKQVAQAVLEPDVAQAGAPAGDSLTLTYDYEVAEALDASAFAFDTKGSQAFGSLQELVGQGPGAGAGGEQQHPLQGQAAPPVALTTMKGQPFKLSDVTEQVVVLDFWATWCGPCRESLPGLQRLYDWAKKEGKSVAIYAVNVGETAKEAQAYWDKASLTMPVLMDTNSAVAGAYGVTGIPQTVIIAGGRVQQVHVGYSPAMERQLKSEIEALLAE